VVSRDATPSGLGIFALQSQGSSSLATLGFTLIPRWGSNPPIWSRPTNSRAGAWPSSSCSSRRCEATWRAACAPTQVRRSPRVRGTKEEVPRMRDHLFPTTDEQREWHPATIPFPPPLPGVWRVCTLTGGSRRPANFQSTSGAQYATSPCQANSHLTSHIPHPTSHIPHPTSHIPHPTSHISLLTSHFSHLTSHISLLTSHFSLPEPGGDLQASS